MKKSERLRQQKSEAVQRMSALVELAKSQSRDLTSDEKTEYEAKKQESESLAGQIDEALKAEAQDVKTVDEAKLRQDAVKAERLRISTIDARLATAKLPVDVATKLRSELVDNGIDGEQMSARIFEEMAKAPSEKPRTNGHHTAAITHDKGDKIRETMSAALLHRYEPIRYKAEAEAAREWTGFSLREMARECLDQKGTSIRGKGIDEVAQLALTTSDLPNILADVANKTLRAGYENYPNTFQSFTRRGTATDFKNIYRTQLSGAAALVKVNENGEIQQSSLTDSKESFSLATYARILSISRKTIINDDLSALTRVPELFGRKAAILEGDIVWAKITANANMSDNVALFHATHGNLGTTGALSADTVAELESKMTLQKGLEGDTLNLAPKYIALPVALRFAYQKLTAPLYPAQVSNVIPTAISSLQPIIEPRLDANSITAYYVFADPSAIDTIEYCYLEGQEGMYFETQMGFEVDGIRFKARHDFGAGVIDYRGMAKNAGA